MKYILVRNISHMKILKMTQSDNQKVCEMPNDSMMPHIHPGDTLFFLRQKMIEYIRYGELYYTVSVKGELIGRLMPGASPDTVLSISSNSLFLDIEIPRREIKELYRFNLKYSAIKETEHPGSITKYIHHESKIHTSTEDRAESCIAALNQICDSTSLKLPQAHFYKKVTDNSMFPTYQYSDYVECIAIKKESHIQWGQTYMLETRPHGAIIKRVKKARNESDILAISDDETYFPFEISKNDIVSMAVVTGRVRHCSWQ